MPKYKGRLGKTQHLPCLCRHMLMTSLGGIIDKKNNTNTITTRHDVVIRTMDHIFIHSRARGRKDAI